MIHPEEVGHVVLKVRDLQKAEQFYTEVLGFTVVTRLKRPAGVFFTLGEQHHDLASGSSGCRPCGRATSRLASRRPTGRELCRASGMLPTTESSRRENYRYH